MQTVGLVSHCFRYGLGTGFETAMIELSEVTMLGGYYFDALRIDKLNNFTQKGSV